MAERAPYRKRDEVREDILRATEEVLATHAPSEVTLRRIARHGGFQHPLITRHFGSKDELVAEVLQRAMNAYAYAYAYAYADAVADTDDPVDGFMKGLEHVANHPASSRRWPARSWTETGRPPARVRPPPSPSIATGSNAPERLLRAAATPKRSTSTCSPFAVMALTTGWAFNEDRWLRTAGYTDADRARVREQLSELIRRLVDDHYR